MKKSLMSVLVLAAAVVAASSAFAEGGKLTVTGKKGKIVDSVDFTNVSADRSAAETKGSLAKGGAKSELLKVKITLLQDKYSDDFDKALAGKDVISSVEIKTMGESVKGIAGKGAEGRTIKLTDAKIASIEKHGKPGAAIKGKGDKAADEVITFIAEKFEDSTAGKK